MAQVYFLFPSFFLRVVQRLPLLAVRASVVRVKLQCPVKVCNKLSDCLSVVGCAVAKKLKYRREGEKKFEFLLGLGKKYSLKKMLQRWVVRFLRVYFL